MLSVKDFRSKQIVFVFPCRGESLHFGNDNVIVRSKDGTVKYQTTCYQLFALFLVGNASITTFLVEKSRRFCFTIVFMKENFKVIAIINSKAEGNVLLRSRQYLHKGDSLGQYIISNKIRNQKAALMHIRKKDDDIRRTISELETYEDEVLRPHLICSGIMGIEGSASRVYFRALFKGHHWNGRRPRAKTDAINCILDIGYTMLFNLINALLELYGFDTYKGVLHRPFFHRKSLACDLVEPFRPIIDMAIRKAANLGEIKERDFYISQNQYSLFGKNAIPYLRMLVDGILEYKEDMYLYLQQYYRMFMRDSKIDEYPVFDLEDNL